MSKDRVEAFSDGVFSIILTLHAKLFKAENSSAQGPRQSVPAITLYGLSILFVFANVYLSFVCFFLALVLYFVPTNRRITTSGNFA